MSITTRPLTPADGERAGNIFFDAVRHGTADVYSLEQRLAWGGKAPNPSGWRQKFQNISGFAAEIDGDMVGFMTLDADGYIDLAFVQSDMVGRGVGRALYDVVEARSVAEGIQRLTTEASKKAKPFFERMGWQVDQEQVVVKNETPLTNFKMSKSLTVVP